MYSIAYANGKRWRVVTLNGEMVEQSGAMSGGGNSVFRGLMSSKMAKDGEWSSRVASPRPEKLTGSIV